MVDLTEASPRLRAPGASFVTLRTPDGALRGCIGSMEATEPLVVDVAVNARRAATRDPRFPPVTPHEVDRLEVHIAVLTPLQPLAVADLDHLRSALRPGIDGVLVEAGRHRGTFLPAVWAELPAVDDFLRHLWAKAGLGPGAWPPGVRIWRYQAVEVS
jgi:AmmeMemoRadiSam system protein A